MSTAYSYALARLPLASTTGVYVQTDRPGESRLVQGVVTLNVVNNRLNSVTVKRGTAKAVNVKREALSHLGLTLSGTAADHATFDSFTR